MSRLLVALGLALAAGWATAQTPQGPPPEKPPVGRGGMGGQRTVLRRAGPGGAAPGARGRPSGAQGGAADPSAADPAGARGEAMRGPSLADSFLRQGSYRAAVAAFTKELSKNPDAPASHVGLGRALARVGRCGEALDHFWPYVDSKPFGEEAALAASVCSSRLGLYVDALMFDRLGLDLDAENVRLLTQYALDLDTVGDMVMRDDALERLLLAKPDRDASGYARAVIALRRGDIDTLDEVLTTWTGEDTARAERIRLEAQSWLDLGDPQEAITVAGPLKLRQMGVQIREIRAEAYRRLGEAERALEMMEGRNGKHLNGGDDDAFRARVAVDLGDLATAAERLADHRSTSDPELLASLWYVARAKGDQAAMTTYAARYHEVESSSLRTLEQLIPLHGGAVGVPSPGPR